MKYTILGFSQPALVEADLDLDDAAILRFLVDFHATGGMTERVINGTVYWWIKYQHVVDNLPILKLQSKDVLARRMKVLAEKGFIEKKTYKVGGTYSYFRFGPNMKSLIIGGGTSQKSEGVRLESRTGTSQKSEQTINLSEDESIKDNTTVPEEPAQTTLLPTAQPKKGKGDPRVPELITYYHDLYVQHAGCKPPVSGAWGKNFKHLLKTYDLDQLKHIIEYFFAYDGRTQYGFFTFVGKVGDLAPNALKTMPREDRSVTQLHRGDEGYVEFTLEDFHRYRKERQG